MRDAISVKTTSTILFSMSVLSAGNKITVVIQNPASNADSVEIAWDDVDVPLIAGKGQVIPPDGEYRYVTGLPQNAANHIGVLGISLGAGAVPVRIMSYATG